MGKNSPALSEAKDPRPNTRIHSSGAVLDGPGVAGALRRGAGRPQTGWWTKLSLHIPPEQFGRYLLVGLANTVVGYGTFALFTAILDRFAAHGYVLASVLSGLLNITFAYLNYKRFVFKTKGNYLREWIRCVAVYGSGIMLVALLLPILVFLLRRWAGLAVSAPYLAGLVLLVMSTIYNFLGNKKFSFRSPA